MSYTIELQTRNGHVEWLASGDMPDGTFTITGHLSPTQEELGIQRRDISGRFAGAASHAHPIPLLEPEPERASVPAAAGGGERIPGEVPLS